MTIVKIGAENVDVLDAECEFRPCFQLGFDKGSFTQGVGYTSYHPGGPKPVCWTRHMNGCPTRGVHLRCGCGATLAEVIGDSRVKPFDDCPRCGSLNLFWVADVHMEVTSCCASPRVPMTKREPRPLRQKCLGCGATLRGERLELARAAS